MREQDWFDYLIFKYFSEPFSLLLLTIIKLELSQFSIFLSGEPRKNILKIILHFFLKKYFTNPILLFFQIFSTKIIILNFSVNLNIQIPINHSPGWVEIFLIFTRSDF